MPQRFYRPFAQHLSRAGFRVLTFDYRGVGTSRPPRLRGFEATLGDWGELDYPAALGFLLHHYGELSTLAAGHSLGGQIVGLAAEASALRGVLTIASQSGYAGHREEPTRS